MPNEHVTDLKPKKTFNENLRKVYFLLPFPNRAIKYFTINNIVHSEKKNNHPVGPKTSVK